MTASKTALPDMEPQPVSADVSAKEFFFRHACHRLTYYGA
jgi:hypothetical protein